MTPPDHDLQHLVSPCLRDLVALASAPDFDHLLAQVDKLAGCTRPVRLHGRTQQCDPATGELQPHRPATEEPLGRLLIACGNRRASRCPTCSHVYAADTYQLIRAGLSGGKTVPDTVAAHPRVFATLTAPSYGPVHNRPDTGRCRCGLVHTDNDSLLGAPLDPERYDYTGAVLFNAHAGVLWARLATNLRRELARRAGLRTRELRTVLTLSFAKVAEYQKRGLVHFHAVIRLDGPDGPTSPPPAWATAELLTQAIRTATARTSLTVHTAELGTRVLHWGHQLDIQEITASGGAKEDLPLTDAAVAAYVAKYATKSAEASGSLDRPVHCQPCRASGRTTTPVGVPHPCAACGGSGLAEPLDDLPDHTRRMIQTCWDLARLPKLAELKLWKWAHMLGFRGHFSTKSRAYSTTLTALRLARREWRADQAGRRHPTTPDTASDSVLLATHWAYTGSGYTPGEHLLANTARVNRAHLSQLRHEGEPRP